MKRILALINVLIAATLLAWPLGVFAVLFMFDAPGSAASMPTYALALSILAYPVPIVAGNLAFWIGRKRATMERLRLYTAITLLGPVLVFAAYLALDLLCDGTFDCA